MGKDTLTKIAAAAQTKIKLRNTNKWSNIWLILFLNFRLIFKKIDTYYVFMSLLLISCFDETSELQFQF